MKSYIKNIIVLVVTVVVAVIQGLAISIGIEN